MMSLQPRVLAIIVLVMRLSLHYDNIGAEAVSTTTPPGHRPNRPNIVIILADDMGFDDVSFHGSDQIPTPNIDALGYQGQILNRHYVAPMCTPSRSVLMTGKYMIRTGMQHYVISNDQPWGLPLTERLLPEYLRERGYKTNLVGKWHLGFAWDAMTPTKRGFDHFRGYLGAYIDYYKHHQSRSGISGYDLRRDSAVDREDVGTYATDLFTEHAVEVIERHGREQRERKRKYQKALKKNKMRWSGTEAETETTTEEDPRQPLFLLVNHLAPHTGNRDDPLQAPEEYVNRFLHIADVRRRIYAAMVTKLDESVGAIVQSLGQQKMLQDTIILFSSDNGAPSLGDLSNSGSNFPFRGQKDSPWEGAIRSAAVLWSRHLETRHINNDRLIYIGDWLPTFLNLGPEDAVPETPPPLNIDGVDQWDVLNRPSQSASVRHEILHNIDPVDGYVSYLRSDGYKFVNGTTLRNEFGGWYGEGSRTADTPPLNPQDYFALVKASPTWNALNEYAAKNLTLKDVMEIRGVQFCQRVDVDDAGENRGEPSTSCDPLEAPCLFNVFEDACERSNLAETRKDVLMELQEVVNEWKLKAVPINNQPGDPLANPKFHNDIWTSWKDAEETEEEKEEVVVKAILAV